jgi:cytochrome b561
MAAISHPEAAPARYDWFAIGLHWLIAVLLVAVVTLGLSIPESTRNGATRDMILLLHRSIGLVILVAMVIRLLWRLSHPPPPLPASMRRVEIALALANHALLYLTLLAMPLLGYVNAAAAGHSVSLFGLVEIPPLIPEDDRLAQIAIALHLAGQFAVYGLVAIHVASALAHAVVRRDGVLRRMLPARSAS